MELFSVEQVAERLGLNVRTVRTYVREGRLPAVRIGKQYRIARSDLEALTGHPVDGPARESIRRHRHIEVSSVVQIDAIDPDTASRLSTTLMAAIQGHRSAADQPLRVETSYDQERGRMKIIVLGDTATTSALVALVGTLAAP